MSHLTKIKYRIRYRKQPSTAASRVWLTAGCQVWQVDLRTTLRSLWRNPKWAEYQRREDLFTLSLLASGVSRMASLLSARRDKSTAACAILKPPFKKLIIGLQASPAQPGQETVPERMGRRRKRRGKKGKREMKWENTTRQKHTTQPLSHFLWISTVWFNIDTMRPCLVTHQTSLGIPPQT